MTIFKFVDVIADHGMQLKLQFSYRVTKILKVILTVI